MNPDQVTAQQSPISSNIAHSVFHPEFVRAEVSRRYSLGSDIKCFLLYRGINDVYLVVAGGKNYALRAWRKTWRDVSHVDYELQFLAFLKERGFSASSAVPQTDGSLWFSCPAAEGERPLALYDWAPGQKFSDCLDETIAQKIGGMLAKMHQLGSEWIGPEHRFTTQNAKEYLGCMPALMDFAYDRPDVLRDYPIIADGLAQRLDELVDRGIPMGVCHRDFHPSNVHVDEEGQITFLDFDAIGEDFLMQDVQNYAWGNHFYDFPQRYAEAFEAGYQNVRPFSAEENENKDLFLMAKALRLLSGMALSSSSVGRGTLRFRNFDWLDDYIRTRARGLDII